MLILLFFIGVLIIGLVTFGGGQAFFALFKYYFLDILNRVSDILLISSPELETIFGLTNATPGPFATKITGFLATIITKPNHNIGVTIIVVLVAYILMTVPAAFIMIWANNKSWKNSKNKLFHNIYKIMKPVTIAILIWVVIGLISNIFLDNNFSWIYEKSTKTIQVMLYLVISFIISFVCLYRFKVNLFLLISFFGGFGFLYFYFIVQN